MPLQSRPHRANPIYTRRHALTMLGAASAALSLPAFAQLSTPPTPAAWADTERAARGQTVFFNAWAGSERINAYLQWATAQLAAQYGVKLEHVKIADTADVVKRVRAEKAAGRKDGEGTVDLVWINGENFAQMKREGLLFGPFAERLPHFQYVDLTGKPTTRIDASIATEGMEAPWGMAQFTVFADGQRLPERPQNMAELLALAQRQPGRISYPRPPDFHGTTFLKQALSELSPNPAALREPFTAAALDQQTAPLWKFLDALHPALWRGGKQFPQNAAAIRQMMADGELLLAWTFNPNEAANEIAAQRLPATVVSWQFAKGSIGNTHFVAIPYNARAKAGAQVVANFLLSPAAQARKADIRQWGDPTVLNVAALPPADRALFSAATMPGQVVTTAPTLPEPHASWVDALEKSWAQRYAR
ncbi:MAG: ABC transporter substrate-binding protein [Acidovorax sp.]|nr:ABC transporter substrate-binding protein [Acidovorax sp.]